VWVIFHLSFLSNNFSLQLRELTSIWKRVVITIIFALGFGMALSGSLPKKGQWALFYLGMLMPAMIFLGKYFLSIKAQQYGFVIPEYLRLYQGRESIYYIYKTDYVSFCLPALAMTLAQLKRNIEESHFFTFANAIYLVAISCILATFYLYNIKNGMAYSALLIIAFIFLLLNSELNKFSLSRYSRWHVKSWVMKMAIIVIISAITLPIINKHINQNPSWKSLIADSKVAIKVDEMDGWKYWGAKGYPLNEYGNPVSPTNYERLAWGIIGLRLLGEEPLGYGLVENSFGYLTKQKWPDSLLLQSHSGWLDLALGIGIPGLGLILIAFFITLIQSFKNQAQDRKSRNAQQIWSTRMTWVLCVVFLLWCTSEISLKIHLLALIFWITLAIGLQAPNKVIK
jgi:hypothetical protein